MTRTAILAVLLLAAAAAPAAAGEPDWFTRVKDMGLSKACETEVARYERGVLDASLHVGECYYRLDRFEAGLAVFVKLFRSPDRNYAAIAQARAGEGLFHLDRIDEARRTFTAVLEEHPDAWLDGSVAELCRAWLSKLDGELASPDAPKVKADADAEPADAVEQVREEVRALTERLEELKRLLEKLRDREERK